MLWFKHKWTWEEDVIVCTYAVERKTDMKNIHRLALYLNLSEGQVQYRLSDFANMHKGVADRHYSKQERKVYRFVTRNNMVMVHAIRKGL